MNQLLLTVWLAMPMFFSTGINGAEEVPQPLIYDWDDDFTEKEKRKMFVWLEDAANAVFDTLGYYPFSIHVYMHKSTSKNEPVPWANTVRGEKQGIHFHVNPNHSLPGFFRDWTAPHEISHLSIPFVGKENMWFSEGYASFMQWYILQNNGRFTLDEVNELYRPKLENAIQQYQSNKSFLKRSNELKKAHDYPALYWGGACYFFQVNTRLKRELHTNLFAVIKQYQEDGRMEDESLTDVISSLDKISNSQVFSETYTKFTTAKSRDAVAGTTVN